MKNEKQSIKDLEENLKKQSVVLGELKEDMKILTKSEIESKYTDKIASISEKFDKSSQFLKISRTLREELYTQIYYDVKEKGGVMLGEVIRYDHLIEILEEKGIDLDKVFSKYQ